MIGKTESSIAIGRGAPADGVASLFQLERFKPVAVRLSREMGAG